MLVVGKGLGEDVTNGAAARPGVAARKGRPREERGRGKRKAERGEETEMSLRGRGCHRAELERAELDPSVRSRRAYSKARTIDDREYGNKGGV
jgi:hypothetical protein